MPWTDRAICHGADPELFFPIGGTPDDALAICGLCPVRSECLEEALAKGHQGIWGGTDEEERRRLRRPPTAQEAPEGSKACTTCDEVKPLTDFYTDQRASDGRQGRCKACHLAAVMARGNDQDPAPISDEQAAHNRAVLATALQTPASTEGTR